MGFTFERLALPGIILVKPKVYGDSRGYFMETHKQSSFREGGILENFIQDNQSSSARNVLRGLHYQKHPKAQGKLVRCIHGTIYDVCVDIRKSSPTYGKWVGEELSGTNHYMLYVPPGFAHGFVVLSEMAEMYYKCTDEYAPELEGGIIWNDPDLAIDWKCKSPQLSARDLAHPRLKDADNNFE
jgi:dTDP-4-dehydrorhamnose 3,5-epimerase